MALPAVRLAFAVLLLGVTLPASSAEPSVVGAWELVSYAREDPATGSLTFPWGEKPAGYLVYLPDGHMSVVITAEGRKPVARGDDGYAEKVVKLFETLTAYAGTYTVQGDSIIHRVEVCKVPEWVGTLQPRSFRLQGDTLALRTQPIVSVSDGKTYVYALVWKRSPQVPDARGGSTVPTSLAPQRIPTSQGRIRVQAGGSGPTLPVLFLHGLGVNLSSWRAQLEHLWQSRRAAAFDFPGNGESDRPSSGEYTVEARARSVGAVADALGYERFVLVGHSYGGLVAGSYAASNPGRVAGVVLADGALDPGAWPPGTVEGIAQSMRDDWDATIARGFGAPLALAREEVRAALYAALEATPRETVISGFAGMSGCDARGTLARYPGPKLSIAAEALDEPGFVHHTVPIPVRFMKGVSHALMMDRPEEFNRHLDAFLASLGASR